LEEFAAPPYVLKDTGATHEQESLTIVALGLLTNVATLLKNRQDLASKITKIALMAGKYPSELFHPGQQRWFHFSDFNVSQDPRATEVVLYSSVALTLISFDLATNVTRPPPQRRAADTVYGRRTPRAWDATTARAREASRMNTPTSTD
jgi:inosine-uridine nucleoside N-ribohydrolase